MLCEDCIKRDVCKFKEVIEKCDAQNCRYKYVDGQIKAYVYPYDWTNVTYEPSLGYS